MNYVILTNKLELGGRAIKEEEEGSPRRGLKKKQGGRKVQVCVY